MVAGALARTPLGVALLLDLDQPLFQRLDALIDHPAVEFDLGFTRTAAVPDAATLADVRPGVVAPAVASQAANAWASDTAFASQGTNGGGAVDAMMSAAWRSACVSGRAETSCSRGTGIDRPAESIA